MLAGQKPIEASRQSNNLSPVRAALTVKKKTDALPRSYAAWLLNEDRGRFSQTPFSTGTSYTNLPGLSGSAKQIRSIRQQGTTHISASYDSGEVGLDWEEADPDGETTFE